MVELTKLELKGKNICNCGYEFTAKNIQNLIRNDNVHYYGGRVTCYSEVICPKCNKNIVILLENYNNSYRVIDIAENIQNVSTIDNLLQNKDTNMQKSNEKCTENVKKDTNTYIKDVGSKENEIVCNNCGKLFKSAAGLASHQKKCLDNI